LTAYLPGELSGSGLMDYRDLNSLVVLFFSLSLLLRASLIIILIFFFLIIFLKVIGFFLQRGILEILT
jgi:hypothetical protein